MNINLVVPLATFAAVLVIVMSAYWLFIDRPENRAALGSGGGCGGLQSAGVSILSRESD
jgi:hypothetical protein